MKLSQRIEVNPKIAFGKPVIAGTRISVDFVLELLSSGWKMPQILKEYPRLSQEDILGCIGYANLKNSKMMEKLHENFSR